MEAGRKLRAYLHEKQRTQTWLAEQLGCVQSVISRYISGDLRPGYSRMVALDKLTGGAVSFADWEATEPEPEPHPSSAEEPHQDRPSA